VIDPFKFEVDQIYNLACPASPPHYQFNPIKTTKTSVMGAINCLGLAKRVKARVFQASTSEVYGDPAVHPQPESYWGNVNPIGRRSCYDEGKRCAETLFFDYHRENKRRYPRRPHLQHLRPAHARGRRSACVSNFIVQALQRRGHHRSTATARRRARSATWTTSSRAGVRLMAQTETVGPMNIGNPGEFTMLELAEVTLKLVAEQVEDRPQAAARRRPQAAAARYIVGAKNPQTGVAKGRA